MKDRLQTIVKHIESYLGQLSEGISNIGESSYMGDNVPKRASTGSCFRSMFQNSRKRDHSFYIPQLQIAAALDSLAQSIANAEESFSDEASSRLKSLLEDFEKVEQVSTTYIRISQVANDME